MLLHRCVHESIHQETFVRWHSNIYACNASYNKTQMHTKKCASEVIHTVTILMSTLHVKTRLNCTKIKQFANHSIIIHGCKRKKTKQYAYTASFFYIHTFGNPSQLMITLNCTIYLLHKIPF